MAGVQVTARKDDLLHRMSQYDNDGRILTHAEYAAKFPPRDGYKCTTDPKGDTNGGGCFNCGWKGARS